MGLSVPITRIRVWVMGRRRSEMGGWDQKGGMGMGMGSALSAASAPARTTAAAVRPCLAQAAENGPRIRCGRGEPSPGADVAGVSPVPPVQMWQGCAQSRRRCGRGEHSPGADCCAMGEPSSRCRYAPGEISPGADSDVGRVGRSVLTRNTRARAPGAGRVGVGNFHTHVKCRDQIAGRGNREVARHLRGCYVRLVQVCMAARGHIASEGG
jgi:hypothetical protein